MATGGEWWIDDWQSQNVNLIGRNKQTMDVEVVIKAGNRQNKSLYENWKLELTTVCLQAHENVNQGLTTLNTEERT